MIDINKNNFIYTLFYKVIIKNYMDYDSGKR